MKAAIFHGPRDVRCGEVADAALTADHQMLVEVEATSICGSDLHVYRGAFAGIMDNGRSTTGHELVGRVVDAGPAVGRFKRGDRVTMAYSISCGDCYMCQVGQTAHCETTNNSVYGFGLPFGDHGGTHAEALVLPHADGHALKVPESIAAAAVLSLSCSLPTAVIANQLADVRPGESLVVVGAGPAGLMAMDIALSRNPGIIVVLDKVAHRLDLARARGATAIDVGDGDWRERALAHSGGRGFDKAIEMVGFGETLAMCLDLVRPGGTVAAMGVFAEPSFDLKLADMFLKDITLHMNGFANVQPAMWQALRMIERGVIRPEEYFTHEFKLEAIDRAFATFEAKSDGAVKMLIRP